MKITQSTLRKIIQEEIGKVREASTESRIVVHSDPSREDFERVLNIAYDIDRKFSTENTGLMNELDQIIAKYEGEWTDSSEEGDEDHRMVDPAELTRRAQEEEKDNYIYRIMKLDPTQDENALENMDIDELEARELLLRRRAER
tara:strand:- start:418 stop:849 length:432 start_codon:yes stop_codon:yes gene_type:complete